MASRKARNAPYNAKIKTRMAPAQVQLTSSRERSVSLKTSSNGEKRHFIAQPPARSFENDLSH